MSTQRKVNFNNAPIGRGRFLGNMRIGPKIIIGYIMLIVLMAIVAGVAYWGMAQVTSLDDTALERQTHIADLYAVQSDMLEQYVYEGHLIINNERTAIEEFNALASVLKQKKNVIRDQEIDTSQEKQWMDDIDQAGTQLEALFNEQIVPAWKAGDKAKLDTLDAQADEKLAQTQNAVQQMMDSFANEEKLTQQEADNTHQLVIVLMLVVPIVAALIGLIFGWVLSRSISGPVQAVAYAAGRLAEGDLTEEIAVSGRDEVGWMAGAFSQMAANLRQLIGQVQQSADQVASASQQLNASSTQAGQAANQVANTIQQIANGTAQQSQAVTEATGNVEQTAHAAAGIAQGSQDQARSVQKTAALAGDMAAIVEQVGQIAAAVTAANGKVTQSARHGASSVEQTGQGMATIRERTTEAAAKVKDLGARSKEIGRIIQTIDDIADKTDMLALNAAVEAARAGEHGRGFAVVADQVRKLSEDSKNSTRDIADLIERVQETISETIAAIQAAAAEVNTGGRLAGDTSQALLAILQAAEEANSLAGQIDQAVKQLKQKSEGVVTGIESVSAVVEENTAAAEEMAANSQEVTGAMENIAGIAEENSASTEEVSASAEEMSAQIEEVVASAEELSALAEELRNAAAQFKL